MINISRQQLIDWTNGTDIPKGRGALGIKRSRVKLAERVLKGEIDVMGVNEYGYIALRPVSKQLQVSRKRRRVQRHARRMTRLHA